MQRSHLIRNSILAIIALLILVTAFYHWWDISIEHYFQVRPHGFLYKLSKDLIAPVFSSFNWLILAIISFIIGLVRRYKAASNEKARPWLFFAYAYFLTFALRTVLKFILARYRPELLFTQHLYGFHFFSMKHAWTSMPSGHAASAFGGLIAIALIFNKKWLTCLLFILATCVAFSRLIIVVHYPSDVIFGAFVGLLSVYWVKTLYEKIKLQKR